MGKRDYSSLENFTLWHTGVVAINDNLIDYLLDNGIDSVASFLECVDNNSLFVDKNVLEKTSDNQMMNQIRGLADILKNKYFGIPMTIDMYLENPVHNITFKLLDRNYQTLGIRGNYKEKTTIYAALSRLGFNSEEIDKIMSKYGNKIYGRNLVDIFHDILVDMYSERKNVSEEDRVFFNKILYLVSYCRSKKNRTNELGTMNEIEILLKELGELLARKDNLDKYIEEVRGNIQLKKNEVRGIQK